MTPIDHRIQSMRHADDGSTVTIGCACGWERTVTRKECAAGRGFDEAALQDGMSRAAFAEHEHHRSTAMVRR